MSDELKACPWCDRLVEAYDFPAGHFIRCNWCGISTPYFGTEKEAIEAWNTRPLEDTLRLERDQAREMVARLIEAGNWLNAMHEDGVFVDELNAARTSWKLAVSDWQAMPSHVTNPLDSQGIVTRNGGEG